MPERCGTLHVNRDPDAMALRARNAEECIDLDAIEQRAPLCREAAAKVRAAYAKREERAALRASVVHPENSVGWYQDLLDMIRMARPRGGPAPMFDPQTRRRRPLRAPIVSADELACGAGWRRKRWN